MDDTAMTTEELICPYCRTVFDYYVTASIETIDATTSYHRAWCKTATPKERLAWMEKAGQEPGFIKYTFPS